MLLADAVEFLKEVKEWLIVLGVIVSALMSYFAKRDAGVAKDEAIRAVPIREEQARTVGEIKTAQNVTNERIDGMKDALVEAVRGQGKAEGALQGIKDEQARVAGDIKEIKTNGGPHGPVPVTIVPSPEPLPVAVVEKKEGI